MVPVTVRVLGALPACALVGETEVIVGNGFKTLSGNVLETPPEGVGLSGFITVICKAPGVAMSDALSAVSTNVELTKVVVRLLPFTATADCATKFDPITFSSTPALPVWTDSGESEEILGTGLVVGLIVNIIPCVVPPPGGDVTTVIVTVPGAWKRDGGIVTFSSPVFTNTGAS